MKLTKKIVEELPFPAVGQTLVWDDEIPLFGLRISAAKKTYIVQGRVRGEGTLRRVSLGSHGVITLQQARQKARKALAAMGEGKDPIEEKKRSEAYALTLNDITKKYLEDRIELKQSSRADIEKHLKKSFHDWAKRPAVEITRDRVAKRFTQLTDKSPAQANQAFRILRALLNYARGAYHHGGMPVIVENPVSVLSETKRWNTVRPRSGRIPTDKIGVAWNVLKSLREAPEQTVVGLTLADAVSFLLLTGARWSEMATLTWAQVNFDDSSWSLPDPKNRQPVTFPLSGVAFKILNARPKDGNYVFPSRIADGHIKDARSVMDKVSEAAGVRVSPHDLRRTFRAIAGKCQIELYKTKLLMNHKMSGDVTIKHYTETSDLRDLSPEINAIDNWIVRQGRIAAAGNVLNFPAQRSKR
ncbi:MAG: tyrosine-type recombinase/integrase [Smithella sp.]